MGRFGQDLSFGFRSLLRQPGFTLVVVLTLVLGIGANAAVVSFAFPILFPAFPHYDDPESLVMLQRWRDTNRPLPYPLISYPVFTDWQERNQVCLELSILMEDSRILTGAGGDPEHIDSLLVSGNVLKTLGVEPHLGRGFVPDDDRLGADRTVMLSYKLWQRRYGGDPEIIDRLITLDGLTYAVVGILPPGMSAERLYKPLGSIWLPVVLFNNDSDPDQRHHASDDTPICRLKPGVSLAAAEEDMARISRSLAEEFPETDSGFKVEAVPIQDLETRKVRPMVLALLTAVAFLFFIACTNLVNLFLSRFVAREQEFAIRLALGAGRKGLVGLAIAEALILAVVASLLGLLVAWSVVRSLPPFLADVPYTDRAGFSAAVFAYTILLCLVVTLVIGLIPSSRSISPLGRRQLTPSLGSRSSPASHRGLRKFLITSEFALALLLVTGTGLAFATFLNMRNENRGFSTTDMLSVDLKLPLPEYADATKWASFFDRTLSVTAALPGVEAVGLLSDPPGNRGSRGPLFAGDQAIPPRDEREPGRYYTVSPGFFELLEIPLIEGRTFVAEDTADSKWVIVVSESVAERFWPDESAVGHRFSFEGWGNINNPSLRWREIVGVVRDVRFRPLSEPPQYSVFVPYTQRPYYKDGEHLPMTLLLKTTIDPNTLAQTVRSEVLKLDPGQPIDNIRMFDEYVADDLKRPRMVLVLFSLIAALALALALAGIYGVMSYLIEARRTDIGIRIALGAKSPEVLLDLLRQNVVPIVIGSLLGWIAAAASARLMSGLLYGVEPITPVVYFWATLVLVTVALLAILIPARRAIHFDPASLLRSE